MLIPSHNCRYIILLLRVMRYISRIGASVIYHDSGYLRMKLYYTGRRIVGYRSDSLNGLMSMIERTSLIALMPLKLALFIKSS